jgi:hypothetical protein
MLDGSTAVGRDVVEHIQRGRSQGLSLEVCCNMRNEGTAAWWVHLVVPQ